MGKRWTLCKSNYREAALEHYTRHYSNAWKNGILQRTRSIEDERSVIVQLTEKEVN
jgi:hypothetical protein